MAALNDLYNRLLEMPYRQILAYCRDHPDVRQICQSRSFWEDKAFQNFRLSVNVVPGDQPFVQYAELEQLYYNEPIKLIIPALRLGEIYILPELLRRSGLVTVTDGDLKLDPLYTIVRMASYTPETAKMFIEYLLTVPGLSRDQLTYLLRQLYFDIDNPEVFDVIEKYYDPSRDEADVRDFYLTAIENDNVHAVMRLRPKLTVRPDPRLEIGRAVKSGDEAMVDFFRQLHPKFFNDRKTMNEIMTEVIAYGHLNSLRVLVEAASTAINYNKGMRLANQLGKAEMTQYLRQRSRLQ